MILTLRLLVTAVAVIAYLPARGDRLRLRLRHATVPTPASTRDRTPRSVP